MTDQQAVLGIDIAKDTFTAALSLPGRDSWLQQEHRNNSTGHRSLQKWLVRQGAQPCRIGIEATGNYGDKLLRSLHDEGHICHLLQPCKVWHHMRARGQGNKTDRQDAISIGHFVRSHGPRTWVPLSAPRREVKELLVGMLALKGQQLRNKSIRTISGNCYVKKMFAQHVRDEQKRIDETFAHIKVKVMDNPRLTREWELYNTINGVGPNLAVHMIAFIDMEQFDNVKQLGSYVGVVPQNHASGSSVRRRAHTAARGHKHLRKALMQAGTATMSGKVSDPALLENLAKFNKNNLKGRPLAMAMGHKLLRNCFGVIKAGKPYLPIVRH